MNPVTIKMTHKEAKATACLLGNRDFQEFLSYLSRVAEEENKRLIQTKTELPQCQGRTQMVTELLTAVTTAQAWVERHEVPKS
jgi:hypothetical protein